MLSRSRCEGTVKAEILVGELILALLAVPFQSAKIYSTLIVYSAHAQKIVALVYSRAAFSPSAQLDSERSWSCELRGYRY